MSRKGTLFLKGSNCILLVFALALSLSACKKQVEEAKNSTGLDGVTVPAGFTWEMSHTVNFSIGVSDSRFGNAMHVVAIYDDLGNLISKGSASMNEEFSTKINLPATVKRVYFIKTAPDGSRMTSDVAVTNTVALKLGAINQNLVKNSGATTVFGAPQSPDCSANCDEQVVIDQSAIQTITVNGGKTVCLQGDFTSSSKQFIINYGSTGGTLKVCAANVKINDVTGLIQNFNEIKRALVITSTGSVHLLGPGNNGINFPGSIDNYGTLAIEMPVGGLSQSGELHNYGLITGGSISLFPMYYTLNNCVNYGTMNLQNFSFGSGWSTGISQFTNYGSINASTAMFVTQSAELVNQCLLESAYVGIADQSTIYNQPGSLIRADWGDVADAGKIAAYNNSMLSFTKLQVRATGSINQQAGASLIKVSGLSSLAVGSKITGNIKLCDLNGVESSTTNVLTGGALVSCNLFIPLSPCNALGNGVSGTIADNDGDGIANSIDDYPNDAGKAFNNPGSGGTLLFEDQWPKKGDYDMNDMVIGYTYTLVTNANNVVVQVLADYLLKATGGLLNNGFGVEFPVSRNSISAITGASLEQNQDKAVAILFTDMHAELPQWNTRKTDPVANAKSYHLVLTLAGGPLLSEFGLNVYNPFIWTNAYGYGRGSEIHLVGKRPTSLAAPALFGQFEDATKIGSDHEYYVTGTGLPWAMDIPYTGFQYALEGKDILTGYPKMKDWLESAGTTYRDWYSNTSAGYRNSQNLY